MKQEWFESNDFVKTTSKNKPEEQAQEVADKTEETIAECFGTSTMLFWLL